MVLPLKLKITGSYLQKVCQMVYGEGENPLPPLNIKKIPKRKTAVSLTRNKEVSDIPLVSAAGRGKIAEQILQLAYENGIPVREDSVLAEMLAKIELDTPIPSEAFMAVAEILSYVYRANGEDKPFDTTFFSD